MLETPATYLTTTVLYIKYLLGEISSLESWASKFLKNLNQQFFWDSSWHCNDTNAKCIIHVYFSIFKSNQVVVKPRKPTLE